MKSGTYKQITYPYFSMDLRVSQTNYFFLYNPHIPYNLV